MKLRDHPLMSYGGCPSWPPAWLWSGGYDNTWPKGEVGFLKAVMPSKIAPHTRCFLIMEHQEALYSGMVLLEDPAFCSQLVEIFQANIGNTLHDIGDIDLSWTL